MVNDGIKIIGLMLVRSEEWVIGCSLRAALDWCDAVVVYLDRCIDRTEQIVMDIQKEFSGGRVIVGVHGPSEHWEEMGLREQTLKLGRMASGTHFAIIDADEIVTANCLPHMRNWAKSLAHRQLLDLPMVPVWNSLDLMRDDDSDWTRSRLTVAFRDHPDLMFSTPAGAYQHHDRPPKNCKKAVEERMWPIDKYQGGGMHLQFANQRRLLAKHVLYRMVDHLRWPNRESIETLNRKYDNALSAPKKLTDIPKDWWGSYRKDLISLDSVPWQEEEIRRLLKAHGEQAFSGLNLYGFKA
jgi:hypothetical protein